MYTQISVAFLYLHSERSSKKGDPIPSCEYLKEKFEEIFIIALLSFMINDVIYSINPIK